ncbi:hypothetical protein F2P81_022782 [Scophthalmus maximus]|uniref:Uncharacterized protein n=1 Tax=Scophthalmus maximus TaxID=52904 RepID=A0A6A4S3Z4_SCOMX|nr:hypothetical protein F2P81_022782 [Scophthalmus maximus]
MMSPADVNLVRFLEHVRQFTTSERREEAVKKAFALLEWNEIKVLRHGEEDGGEGTEEIEVTRFVGARPRDSSEPERSLNDAEQKRERGQQLVPKVHLDLTVFHEFLCCLFL